MKRPVVADCRQDAIESKHGSLPDTARFQVSSVWGGKSSFQVPERSTVCVLVLMSIDEKSIIWRAFPERHGKFIQMTEESPTLTR